MSNISWIHLVILILASFRLTHLIVYDEIASFIRRPFITEVYNENTNGELEKHMEIRGTGIRRWMGMLLSCYWCTGIWSSLFLVLLYGLVPASFPVLVLLAVAGVAAVIESKI